MGWNDWERAAERGPMAVVWRVIGCVVLVSVVLGLIGFFLNPFRQAGRIIDKTIDADNVILNYEWFKQRNQDVMALDAKIDGAQHVIDNFATQAGPRKDWKRDDREEYARLSSIHQGLMQQRNDLAAEYNARTQMQNRSLFKTSDLPATISIR